MYRSWKFNNSLLEDDDYKELMAFYYPQILRKYVEVTDRQLLWKLWLQTVGVKMGRQDSH